ncbi:MAG: chemotaxis protein MotA [Myxococcota bacterium]|jgi:chemotaxis protein MotA
MDLATIIGFIATVLLLVAAILIGGPLTAFVDYASVAVVIGGTMGAVYIGFPGGQVKSALGAGKFALKPNSYPPGETVKLLQDLSAKARSEGLLSLEAAAEEASDPFLKRGLQLMADGQDQDTVESVMYGEMDKISERHKGNVDVWDGIGSYAPAMGMIGTLIGLVQMLQNMSDPAAIGPAMAVALLTTFYGSLIANLIGIPIANKLKLRNKQEVAHMELIVTGMSSILAGENPRFLVERLNSTLAPADRLDEAA